MIIRKKITPLLLVLLLFGLIIISQIINNKKRPNILFVVVDDLKPILSCYGNKTAITPNIDKLARKSTIFLNNHCQQAICGPSRASMLTGLRPDETQVWELFTQMRETNTNILTLPEYLRKNGYETAGAGKVFDASCVDEKFDEPSWSVPFRNFEEKRWHLSSEKVATEAPEISEKEFTDAIIANQSLDLIEMLSVNEKPFFISVGFLKPHLPFVAPKKYWDLYNRDSIEVSQIQSKTNGSPDYAFQPSWELRSGYTDIPPKDPLPIEMQKELIHGYYACVSHIDNQIGRLLSKLDSLRIKENTIVILVSDHGYHLGDHSMWCKHTNYEQATRTPMIISSPEYNELNKTKSPTELIDIFPTICDLIGIKTPNNINGKSLVPILRNGKEKVKDFAVTQYHRTTKDGIKLEGYSIRTEQYRYTEWIKGLFKDNDGKYESNNVYDRELFDYYSFPDETENLINKDKYQNVIENMKKLIKEYFVKQNRFKN